MNYLNIILSSQFFITREHNITFTRVNLSKSDAERYGFTPICIAYLKNTITDFEYFEFINPKIPFSVTKFLIEAWDKVKELNGIPSKVSINEGVFKNLQSNDVSEGILPVNCGISFEQHVVSYSTPRLEHIEAFCSEICFEIADDHTARPGLTLSDINDLAYKYIIESQRDDSHYVFMGDLVRHKLTNAKISMSRLRKMLTDGALPLCLVTAINDIICKWGRINIPSEIRLCRPVEDSPIYYSPDKYEGREQEEISEATYVSKYESRWVVHLFESLARNDRIRLSDIISQEIISSFMAGHSYLPRAYLNPYINAIRKSSAIFFINAYVAIESICGQLGLMESDFLCSSSRFDGTNHSLTSILFSKNDLFYMFFIEDRKLSTKAFNSLSPENQVAHNVESVLNQQLVSLTNEYKSTSAITARSEIFQKVYEVYSDIHDAADKIVASGERKHFLYEDKTALVLQYLLDELNITQSSLARNAGVKVSLVFRLLNPTSSSGIKVPTDDHLVLIAKYFKITIDQLRGMEDFTFIKHASVERELKARRRKYETYASYLVKNVMDYKKLDSIYDVIRILADTSTSASTARQIHALAKHLVEQQKVHADAEP